MTETYDLEEQTEPEQFTVEQEDTKLSTDVYKKLKEEKKYQKYITSLKKKEKPKHKACFHRVNNVNHYYCDGCNELTHEEQSKLIYNKDGEFAYCYKCLKERYPNYTPVRLATTVSKTDMLSNHADTKYNKGFK